MTAPLYYLAVRGPGRKWFAIAGTNSGGCSAGAEDVFAAHGLKGDPMFGVHWAERLESQKNFAGRAAGYREVEMTEEARKLWWYKTHVAMPWYKSLAHFLETFPDAAPYAAELATIKA